MSYASAVISYLDRESGKVNKIMSYPITRVELFELRGDELVVARIFVVGADGRWAEVN